MNDVEPVRPKSIEDDFCHYFRGCIHPSEGLVSAQVRVAQRREDLIEPGLRKFEINDHAQVVEPRSGEHRSYAPIVTVQGLAGSVSQPELVRCGEYGFYGHRKQNGQLLLWGVVVTGSEVETGPADVPLGGATVFAVLDSDRAAAAFGRSPKSGRDIRRIM